MTKHTVDRLYDFIQERRKANPDSSYIAKRFKQGTPKIAQKLGEEAVELVIAALQHDKKEIVSESADMFFHWLMLLADADIAPEEVMQELTRRENIEGFDEKANRKARRKGDL